MPDENIVTKEEGHNKWRPRQKNREKVKREGQERRQRQKKTRIEECQSEEGQRGEDLDGEGQETEHEEYRLEERWDSIGGHDNTHSVYICFIMWDKKMIEKYWV